MADKKVFIKSYKYKVLLKKEERYDKLKDIILSGDYTEKGLLEIVGEQDVKRIN
jgi:hypothetical protein